MRKNILAVLLIMSLLGVITGCSKKDEKPVETKAVETTAIETEPVIEVEQESVKETKAVETEAETTPAETVPETEAETNVEEATVSETEGQPSEEPLVGMANPWVETDAAGVQQKIGVEFGVPAEVTDVKYRVCEDLGIAEMTFNWYKMPFTARIKPTADFEDISGIYNTWETTEDCMIGYCEGKEYRGTDSVAGQVNLCLWYDRVPGIMYSLSTSSNDLNGFDITAIAAEVFKPMQGEVSGDSKEVSSADLADSGYVQQGSRPFAIALGKDYHTAESDDAHLTVREWVQEPTLFKQSDFEAYRLDSPEVGNIQLRFKGIWYTISPEWTDLENPSQLSSFSMVTTTIAE